MIAPWVWSDTSAIDLRVRQWIESTLNTFFAGSEKINIMIDRMDEYKIRPLYGCKCEVQTIVRAMCTGYEIGRKDGINASAELRKETP